jgi:Cu+-exporting ATPase
MTCSICTSAVTTALKSLQGVSSCSVSLALQEAHIEYDPSMLTRQDLVDAIESIGYDVVQNSNDGHQMNDDNNGDGRGRGEDDDDDDDHRCGPSSSVVDFTVTGMTCSVCCQSIQTALLDTDGVLDAHVALSMNIAHVVYDPNKVSPDTLRAAIEDIGFDVVDTTTVSTRRTTSRRGRNNNSDDNDEGNQPVTEDRLERLLKQQQVEVNNRKRAFIWSFVGAVPILIITMVLSHFPAFALTRFMHQTVLVYGHRFVLEALLLWAICTPIQFGCGWPFYKSTYYGLRQGIMGMDVLVAVGTSASYGYAVWATFTPGSMEYHFFETSAGKYWCTEDTMYF